MQQQAQEIIARGPNLLSGKRFDTMRYFLSDLIDDLSAKRPSEETAALSAQIYARLIDLILLGRNQWTGRGKWRPRLLRQFDPALADVTTKAFAEAVQGETAASIALAEQVLDQHGARYLDGYHVDAPLHARISAANTDPR